MFLQETKNACTDSLCRQSALLLWLVLMLAKVCMPQKAMLYLRAGVQARGFSLAISSHLEGPP